MGRDFIATVIINFFIAFGVILGGAIIGGLACYLVGKPPIAETMILANKLKIWAIVASMGGTFDTLSNFERSFFNGAMEEVFKQLVIIFIAMAGANTAMVLLQWLTQEHFN